MKTTILIISAVLILISQGSILTHRVRNSDAFWEYSKKGQIILFFATVAPFIVFVITMNKLIDLSWYWVLIISVVIIRLIPQHLTPYYYTLLGYKSKPIFKLSEGGFVRFNLHIVDFCITFIAGLGLLIVALMFSSFVVGINPDSKTTNHNSTSSTFNKEFTSDEFHDDEFHDDEFHDDEFHDEFSSNESHDEFSSGKKYTDGEYNAEIKYYNSNTRKHSVYKLSVEVENGELVKIEWPNGGWLDDSHFSPPNISDGTASFKDDRGIEYDIRLIED